MKSVVGLVAAGLVVLVSGCGFEVSTEPKELDDGRLVRIGATVTIEDVEGEGRFGIAVDKKAEEFGVTGRSVFEELAKSYEQRFDDLPTGSCPEYLPGEVGETMTCTLQTSEGRLRVRVEVTRVRAETFETQYTYETLS